MSPSPTRGAFWVAAGIFLSRISGLARQVLFAQFFGTSPLADAWTAALRLPAVLQNLLGEGSLSASFIPVYAEQVGEGRDEDARRFAGAVLGLLMLVAGALVLATVAFGPWIVQLLLPGYGPEKLVAMSRLIPLLFPMAGFLILSAWALGILNTHRRFFLSYVAPVLWNGAMIVALAWGGFVAGKSGLDLLVWMGWGALAGGALQLLIQLPLVLRLLGGVRLSLNWRTKGMRSAMSNFLPVVGARGFESLSGFLREVTLASLLATGAVAILGYVQPFYLLPISLFGLSVAAAELPELAQRRTEDTEVLAQRVGEALHTVQFWVVPTAVSYIVLGRELMGLVYQRGRFGPDDAAVAHYVLAVLSLGLLASASSRLLSSTFYALREARTPARVAMFRIVVSFGLGALLMGPFDRFQVGDLYLGAVGLAVGAAAAAWMEYAILRREAGRRIGRHGAGASRSLRVWGAALASGALSWGVAHVLRSAPPVWLGTAAFGAFGLIYLGLTRLLGLAVPGRRR